MHTVGYARAEGPFPMARSRDEEPDETSQAGALNKSILVMKCMCLYTSQL